MPGWKSLYKSSWCLETDSSQKCLRDISYQLSLHISFVLEVYSIVTQVYNIVTQVYCNSKSGWHQLQVFSLQAQSGIDLDCCELQLTALQTLQTDVDKKRQSSGSCKAYLSGRNSMWTLLYICFAFTSWPQTQ